MLWTMRFECDVLHNLCGNGSLEKSLATVNLLTIWDESLEGLNPSVCGYR